MTRLVLTLREVSSPRLRPLWILVLVLMVLVAAVETAFTALFFAFATLLAGQSTVPAVPGLAIVLGEGARPSVGALAAVLAAVVIVRALLGVSLAYCQSFAAARDGADLARRLLERYLSAPFGVMRQRDSAYLVRNINNSVEAVFGGVAVPVALIAAELLVCTGIVAVLALISPLTTACAALVAFVMAVVVIKVMHPVQFALGMRSQELAARQFGELHQVFAGLREVKVFRTESFFVERFRTLRGDIGGNQARVGFLAGLPRIVVETVFLLAVVLGAVAITAGKAVEAELLALFGLFAYAGLRLMPSAARIISCFNMIRLSEPAMLEVVGDFRTVEASTPAVPTVPCAPWNEIRISSATFTYPGRTEPALRGVSFTLKRGQSVGITGRSGSGKSTLVDLVIGLLTPQAGSVVTDGGVRLAGGRVIEGVGYVPQQPILLNASVRENIAFGVAPLDIDDRAVAEAATLAQIDDFVRGLEDGYRTPLGELGSRLSGGQRQRIAVARALYHRPEILVFDEATSALDLGTENALAAALAELRGKVTQLIIAHRLNTIRQCDTILLLERGALAAQGHFDALSGASREFQELVRLHELE